MTDRATIITIIVLGIVVIWGAWAWHSMSGFTAAPSPVPPAAPAPSPAQSGGTNPETLTLAGGEISMSYPAGYGLAVSKDQVPVRSYIPPCDQGFDYCFYYNGDAYKGTNFESAGLRVKRRADLTAERLCLNTPPEGFSSTTMPSATASNDLYSASSFRNVGDAAAGHYAEGSLYRLFMRKSSSCYEFETRIGATQFANYPPGAIKEFTDAMRQAVRDSLQAILASLRLVSGGQAVVLPK